MLSVAKKKLEVKHQSSIRILVAWFKKIRTRRSHTVFQVYIYFINANFIYFLKGIQHLTVFVWKLRYWKKILHFTGLGKSDWIRRYKQTIAERIDADVTNQLGVRTVKTQSVSWLFFLLKNNVVCNFQFSWSQLIIFFIKK